MSAFKDTGHLVRLATAFAIGTLLFFALRGYLVPKSFGQYGHYRGAALGEIAAQPISYAGHEVCETCHSEILDVKKAGRHAHVACESCHGPQAKHAEDPGSVVPQKLDTAVLCVRCHEANHSKPMDFPQVHSAEHSFGLKCDTCHQPHTPRIEEKGKK
jgi:transcription elongation factor Elf1